jgi:hypothetical protein
MSAMSPLVTFALGVPPNSSTTRDLIAQSFFPQFLQIKLKNSKGITVERFGMPPNPMQVMKCLPLDKGFNL